MIDFVVVSSDLRLNVLDTRVRRGASCQLITTWKWPGREKSGPPCLGCCPRDPTPVEAADDGRTVFFLSLAISFRTPILMAFMP